MVDTRGMAMASDLQTPERRENPGLVFDPDAGSLTLGGRTASLPERRTNRAVLSTYVELIAAARGTLPADTGGLRAIDIDALAESLDLDSAAILDELSELLKVDRHQAVDLLARLRESRVAAGIAKVALAGTLLAGGVALASCAAPGGSSNAAAVVGPSQRQSITAEAPKVKPHPPIEVAADKVGLTEPMTLDHKGVGLVPAAVVDAPN